MANELAGRQCRLIQGIRDAAGVNHSTEEVLSIKKSQLTLGKLMWLCSFPNGTCSYLFPDEFVLLAQSE